MARGGKYAQTKKSPAAAGNIPRISRAAAVVVSIVSLALTAVLLYGMTMQLGGGGKTAASRGAGLDITGKFDMYMTNRIGSALDGLVTIERKYFIGKDQLVAPHPKDSAYGQTTDKAQLRQLLTDAEKVLKGQKMYFDPDMELFPGSEVRYYLDDSLVVVVWKQAIDRTVYTFAEAKMVHPSQFRRFLSDGQFGSSKLYLTTEMADSVNAVVAASGDYYGYRPQGVIVYDGVVYKANNGLEDICYITNDGDMLFTRNRKFSGIADAQQFVDENDINFSLAFGPVLVENGERVDPDHYSIGEMNGNYSRAALCQMDDLHYMVVTANTEGDDRSLPKLGKLAKILYETGCRHAYTLDGGQTATIAMNGETVNAVNYGYQRKISDIIYFATAVPDGG